MTINSQALFHYFKDRWVLWLAVVMFIIFKWPHLSYPFYWDESWSYEPGLRLMYEHGPSLMPNAIDTGFSRGHPLLFYFLSAAWMRVFGPAAFSQHVFALTVSVLLIISVYEVCLSLFNKRTAILTLAILPLQCIFFVQSAMLLPEVMVALLSLLSIYFYATGKRALTFIFLLATLLTKESGAVTGLLLGADATLRLFNKTTPIKQRIGNFLPVLFAGMGIVLFFITQRILNGWFFFPEHMGYISFKWDHAWGLVKYMLGVLFDRDSREILFKIVLFFSLILSINTRKVKYLLPVVIALLVYTCLNEMYYDIIPRRLVAVLLLCAIVCMIYQLTAFTYAEQNATKKFIRLCVSFFLLYTIFCSVNYFTARYTLPSLVIILILTAYYLERVTAMLPAVVYTVTVVVIILNGQYAINHSTEHGDVDMGAFDGMNVQQDLVHFLEQGNYYNAHISTTNFQDYVHLTDPNTGFIKNKEFTHVDAFVNYQTQYAVFNNVESGAIYDSIKNTYKTNLIYRTEHKGLWGEIYRLK